jgi:transcription elongation factor GreA
VAARTGPCESTGLFSCYLVAGTSAATEDGMEKIPLTARGFAKLDAELKKLKSVERPAIIAAIAEAREHGDLSENAEYHSAREKQSFIEGRIKELESIVGRSEVIDPSRLSGTIKFGATVVLVDEDTDEEKTFQIVGEQEASIEEGLLNLRSPLARALIGKEEGESVEVRTPGGVRSYEIRAVNFL